MIEDIKAIRQWVTFFGVWLVVSSLITFQMVYTMLMKVLSVMVELNNTTV